MHVTIFGAQQNHALIAKHYQSRNAAHFRACAKRSSREKAGRRMSATGPRFGKMSTLSGETGQRVLGYFDGDFWEWGGVLSALPSYPGVESFQTAHGFDLENDGRRP
jgi:hypothetical protein